MSILDILAKNKIIEDRDIPAIKQRAKASGIKIEEVLEKIGVPTDEILKSRSEFFGVPIRNLAGQTIPKNVLDYIPSESVEYYKIAPISLKDGMLEVGMVNPDDIEAKDALNFISTKIDLPIKIFLISDADFSRVFAEYTGMANEVGKAVSEIQADLGNAADGVEISKGSSTSEDVVEDTDAPKVETKIIEDAPVTKIVATILRYATEGNASDIHIEHSSDSVKVRFRVDGVLNTSLVLPAKVHSAIVSRIKILCNMRLDEKRKPQDGRFTAKIEGRKIDFRVSTFPAYYGEKIVMRILDVEKGVKKLSELGISAANYELITKALKRPYGLVLVSGPTGSGKSTTLYSMLNEIDRDRLNVLSLEDPVEYTIDGVSQSQVRADIGYTFATGLRTTLRQDPDVIMVGEIRDKETAGLAIQAALTGHLVISTIHTNNAIGVIPRLVDMGVDPYLIAPTLIMAIAQRLVRKTYPGTGLEMKIEGPIQEMVDKQFADLPQEFKDKLSLKDKFWNLESTAECPSGTRGRMAVMEVLNVTKELSEVILKNPVDEAIYKVARRNGMLNMKEDAILKAMDHTIPFEEINTV